MDQLPLTYALTRDQPTTQAYASTRSGTRDLLVCRTTPNPLSHTSQGYVTCFLQSDRLSSFLTKWLPTTHNHSFVLSSKNGVPQKKDSLSLQLKQSHKCFSLKQLLQCATKVIYANIY